MGDKTIHLSEKAYNRLAALKEERESFTEVVLRLCAQVKKRPLASFAGAWSMSEAEEQRIFSELSELWKQYEESLLGH